MLYILSLVISNILVLVVRLLLQVHHLQVVVQLLDTLVESSSLITSEVSFTLKIMNLGII